jgi:hypothetical protein
VTVMNAASIRSVLADTRVASSLPPFPSRAEAGSVAPPHNAAEGYLLPCPDISKSVQSHREKSGMGYGLRPTWPVLG